MAKLAASAGIHVCKTMQCARRNYFEIRYGVEFIHLATRKFRKIAGLLSTVIYLQRSKIPDLKVCLVGLLTAANCVVL